MLLLPAFGQWCGLCDQDYEYEEVYFTGTPIVADGVMEENWAAATAFLPQPKTPASYWPSISINGVTPI